MPELPNHYDPTGYGADLTPWPPDEYAIVVRPRTREPEGVPPYVLPVGTMGPKNILEQAGYETAPIEGGTLNRAEYPELYFILGDKWGDADEGEFRLPDMRGRALRVEGES